MWGFLDAEPGSVTSTYTKSLTTFRTTITRSPTGPDSECSTAYVESQPAGNRIIERAPEVRGLTFRPGVIRTDAISRRESLHIFTRGEWAAFVGGVRNGEFD